MRLSLTLAFAIAAAVVAAQPIGVDVSGASVGVRGFEKRDNAPENKPPHPQPEQKPAPAKHDEPHPNQPHHEQPHHEEPHHEEPHKEVHPPSNGQPEHIHIEHTEHPGGNPSNVEHISQDIVNKPHEHTNIVQHVSMSNNHIQGQPTAHIVSGTQGISISGKGNTVVTDNLKGGVVKTFGPDGGVILVETGRPAPVKQKPNPNPPRK
ncbi:hypothetical protein LPJ78_003038 [Coemansia sp. RSA 989]|nr:hypothetical protein LPJ68_005255 [Coemansia sp. RSA 1086]KAJ1864917.1 hypothetical protein LPJ78_003038 [Coemansia sp. RSA 989]KAJ2631824.1 hypothetical protein H4R22_001706 [Coemansia sp. RSA 1290]KAJ2649394.1 hypothetical protein IWW40_003241 [Coemansia sp. RSA 1250]KAJ2672248.1 hypothetical protein IWW42_002974 [Coemansia sp. RSA 1085]